jgi:hypothetical protein
MLLMYVFAISDSALNKWLITYAVFIESQLCSIYKLDSHHNNWS